MRGIKEAVCLKIETVQMRYKGSQFNIFEFTKKQRINRSSECECSVKLSDFNVTFKKFSEFLETITLVFDISLHYFECFLQI